MDGKPYFSIDEIGTFINGFGTLEKAAAALQRFEQKTKAAGFPGLHLNVMAWGFNEGAMRATVRQVITPAAGLSAADCRPNWAIRSYPGRCRHG